MDIININALLATGAVATTLKADDYIVISRTNPSTQGSNNLGYTPLVIPGSVLNSLLAGYTTVEDEGVALPQRSTMNFVGTGVTVTDVGGKTTVTVGGSLSANNGLTVTGTNIQLGGPLIQNTSIDMDGFNFSMIDNNSGFEFLQSTNQNRYSIVGGLGGNTYLNANQPTNLLLFAGNNALNSTFGAAGGIVLIGSSHTIAGATSDTWLFGDYGDVTDSNIINSFGRSNTFNTSDNIVNIGVNNTITGSSTLTVIGQNSSITDSAKVYLANNNFFAVLDNAGYFGVGTTTPTGRGHFVGTTNDNTAYALKAQSSTAADLLLVRNDGIELAYFEDTGKARFGADSYIQKVSGSKGLQIHGVGAGGASVDWVFGWNAGELLISGNFGGQFMSATDTAANTSLFTTIQTNANGSRYDYGIMTGDFKIRGTLNGVGNVQDIIVITQSGAYASYVGVGLGAPTAMLHTQGNTSDNTAYAFRVTDSSANEWFSVRNDGSIIAGAQAGSSQGSMTMGYGTPSLTAIGINNTVFGLYAGGTMVGGSYNVAVGTSALQSAGAAGRNVAIGVGSLGSLTTGFGNIAMGFGAGQGITTDQYVTSLGYNTLTANTNGGNTAVGGEAGVSTTGAGLTLVGYAALGQNTAGNYITAVGQGALFRNNTGNNNTALGYGAGHYNIAAGSDNVYLGFEAGYYNNDAGNNTGTVGRNQNVIIGSMAGSNYAGSGSVIIGYSAGATLVSGDGKLVIDNADTATPLILGDFTSSELAFRGSISTADPGSGSGKWKLGQVTAAAVALDAANYVEVNIDGAVVKLGIVT